MVDVSHIPYRCLPAQSLKQYQTEPNQAAAGASRDRAQVPGDFQKSHWRNERITCSIGVLIREDRSDATIFPENAATQHARTASDANGENGQRMPVLDLEHSRKGHRQVVQEADAYAHFESSRQAFVGLPGGHAT